MIFIYFYLQENDFDAFISKYGGYSNAVTGFERTTFHFSIQQKHILPAIDRFAQFFIKPLMKREAITRERKAVESGTYINIMVIQFLLSSSNVSNVSLLYTLA